MTDQVTAPFWQPHSQVSQASESWQIFFAILFIWEEKRCLDRFFNCTYSTQLRKDLSMIFICSYECTPIKHIIHKPNCEMMCEILSRQSSLSSDLVHLFSSLIVQNHSAIQYYLINLEPFRALHGSDWRFCKRVGPSGSSSCKTVFAFFFSQESFFDHCCPILYFFADVVHLVVVEEADDVEHIELKQCKVGIAKILSARRKVTSKHFIKGPLVNFLYPATGHKLWLLTRNENASNIKRLFPEFSGDGGVERSNVLGLRGFHSNRTSLWSGHLLPMQGFFQVTFVFRSLELLVAAHTNLKVPTNFPFSTKLLSKFFTWKSLMTQNLKVHSKSR